MSDIGDCTVLLVDDAVENMDILVAALGNEVDITVAMDGDSALEVVSEERPALILLDIEMPGMDGYEVYRCLKANPQTASIPVVFLSARSDPAAMAKGLEMGAVDFITKPFAVAEVLAKVRNILTRGLPCKEVAPA